jgi:hypothetical protein
MKKETVTKRGARKPCHIPSDDDSPVQSSPVPFEYLLKHVLSILQLTTEMSVGAMDKGRFMFGKCVC